MSRPAGPCHNCEDRELGYHGRCIAYKKWEVEHAAEKEKENRKRREVYAGQTIKAREATLKRRGAL